MFEACPGFEDLSLRVEVRWQNRPRRVSARLCRWPNTNVGFLLCELEDSDEGPWIMLDRNGLRHFQGPQTLLAPRPFFVSEARFTKKFTDISEQRLTELVRRAFSGDDHDCRLARVFRLDELPTEPLIAIETNFSLDAQLCWCPGALESGWIPFDRADSTPLNADGSQALQQLRGDWRDTDSNARFAWEWFGWNVRKRYEALTGIAYRSEEVTRVKREMERLMRLILISEAGDSQDLWFDLGSRSHVGFEDWVEKNDETAHGWNQIMLRHLLPNFRHDWMNKHLCVQEFWWGQPISASASINPTKTTVTAHEQIEAEHTLRDWLQGKATPAEIEQLLAI